MNTKMNMNYMLGAAGIGLVVILGGVLLNKYYLTKKSKKQRLVALKDSQVKYPFTLVNKEIITHDTRKFTFALPSKEHVLGLPLGQHIYLSADINGDLVIRPYTPTSSDDDKGYFELVVKIYKANVHPRFPEGGKMSQYLDTLKPGDTINVRGPSGRLIYKRNGKFEITTDKKQPPALKQVKHVGMIAGGSGLTPMYQLIKDICNNPDDNTKLSLIYANQTQDDIMLRQELDAFAANHSDKFTVWYTIDRSVESGKIFLFDSFFSI
jgi:cytochrome-b5 reductase